MSICLTTNLRSGLDETDIAIAPMIKMKMIALNGRQSLTFGVVASHRWRHMYVVPVRKLYFD